MFFEYSNGDYRPIFSSGSDLAVKRKFTIQHGRSHEKCKHMICHVVVWKIKEVLGVLLIVAKHIVFFPISTCVNRVEVRFHVNKI